MNLSCGFIRLLSALSCFAMKFGDLPIKYSYKLNYWRRIMPELPGPGFLACQTEVHHVDTIDF